MSTKTIRESKARKTFLVVNNIFFGIILFLCLYPMWYVLIQSFSDGSQAVNALILPRGFTFRNYQKLLGMPEIFRAFGMSVLRTVVGTGLTTMCCMLLGYLFSKQDMPFRKTLYRMLVVTSYVSGGMIPTFLVFKTYGLMNNFWVYIFPSLISAYYCILIKTFVEQMPQALEESAMIDGANTMVIFMKIVLPLALPIMATIAIYQSVSQWNSWFDYQLYNVTDKSLMPLQYLLHYYLEQAEKIIEEMELQGEDVSHLITPRGVKMTVTMVTVVPILCVYPYMQRYLIKGIMIGAVKG